MTFWEQLYAQFSQSILKSEAILSENMKSRYRRKYEKKKERQKRQFIVERHKLNNHNTDQQINLLASAIEKKLHRMEARIPPFLVNRVKQNLQVLKRKRSYEGLIVLYEMISDDKSSSVNDQLTVWLRAHN